MSETGNGAMARPLRIGLLWHSVKSGNLGVGALTLANIRLISEALATAGRKAELTVFGFADSGAPYPSLGDVSFHSIRTRDLVMPKKLISAFSAMDVVIDIGGGDSFAGIYGMKRFGFMVASKQFVLSANTPLVLAPQTIGPFGSRLQRRLAGRMVEKSCRAFIRDELSLAEFPQKTQSRIGISTDVAFALAHDEAPPEARGRVGLNVSGLLYHRERRKQNAFALILDYRKFICLLIEALKTRVGSDLLLVPHVFGPEQASDNDYHACLELSHQYDLAAPPYFNDPVAAKTFISGLDFFCGSRMHACIAAVSSGVPTAPVAYSRKFSGLFGALGYDWTIDGREIEASEAVGKVIAAYDERDAIRQDCLLAISRAQARLQPYRDTLVEILTES